jgi:hypothetical protein
MPECFCPEELAGACYFEPVSSPMTDWAPNHEHFPRAKREGGHRELDNTVLAHVLCNRIDYSITVGRPTRETLRGSRKPAKERLVATMRDKRDLDVSLREVGGPRLRGTGQAKSDEPIKYRDRRLPLSHVGRLANIKSRVAQM